MSEDAPRRMNIREFRERGYLQELNRRFLHPLGLALEVLIHDDGTMSLGGVWDYRDDPEGIRFAIRQEEDAQEEVMDYMLKSERVYQEEQSREPARRAALGYWIQPLSAKALALRDTPASGAA